MSKKHFIQLAKAIRESKPVTPCEGGLAMSLQWRKTAEAIVEVCAANNPNFDRGRFCAACALA